MSVEPALKKVERFIQRVQKDAKIFQTFRNQVEEVCLSFCSASEHIRPAIRKIIDVSSKNETHRSSRRDLQEAEKNTRLEHIYHIKKEELSTTLVKAKYVFRKTVKIV